MDETSAAVQVVVVSHSLNKRAEFTQSSGSHGAYCLPPGGLNREYDRFIAARIDMHHKGLLSLLSLLSVHQHKAAPLGVLHGEVGEVSRVSVFKVCR